MSALEMPSDSDSPSGSSSSSSRCRFARDCSGEQLPEGAPERRREAVMVDVALVVQVPARAQHGVEVNDTDLSAWGGEMMR